LVKLEEIKSGKRVFTKVLEKEAKDMEKWPRKLEEIKMDGLKIKAEKDVS